MANINEPKSGYYANSVIFDEASPFIKENIKNYLEDELRVIHDNIRKHANIGLCDSGAQVEILPLINTVDKLINSTSTSEEDREFYNKLKDHYIIDPMTHYAIDMLDELPLALTAKFDALEILKSDNNPDQFSLSRLLMVLENANHSITREILTIDEELPKLRIIHCGSGKSSHLHHLIKSIGADLILTQESGPNQIENLFKSALGLDSDEVPSDLTKILNPNREQRRGDNRKEQREKSMQINKANKPYQKMFKSNRKAGRGR